MVTPGFVCGCPRVLGLDGAAASRRMQGQVQMSCHGHLPQASQHCGVYSEGLMSDAGLSSLQQLFFLLINVEKGPGGPVQPPVVGWPHSTALCPCKYLGNAVSWISLLSSHLQTSSILQSEIRHRYPRNLWQSIKYLYPSQHQVHHLNLLSTFQPCTQCCQRYGPETHQMEEKNIDSRSFPSTLSPNFRIWMGQQWVN